LIPSACRTRATDKQNQLNALRLDRASAYYRVRLDLRPLQVETLRTLQQSADAVYERGQTLLRLGRLKIKLSPNEALGNYVDREVRQQMRDIYTRLGISPKTDPLVRVVGREYDTSGTDRTYRVPDVRVGSTAYDVTLTPKTLATRQIVGFFEPIFAAGGRYCAPTSSWRK